MSTAEALVEAVSSAYPNTEVRPAPPNPKGFDVIINTTSLGLNEDDKLPIDPKLLNPSQLVAEIIMNPEETAILKVAKTVGCRIHYGRPMFDHQVAIQAKLFGYNFQYNSGLEEKSKVFYCLFYKKIFSYIVQKDFKYK